MLEIYKHQKNNNRQEIEHIDTKLFSFPPNEGLRGSTNTHRSNTPQQSQVASKDGRLAI